MSPQRLLGTPGTEVAVDGKRGGQKWTVESKEALLELCVHTRGHVGRTSKEVPGEENVDFSFYFLLTNPLHPSESICNGKELVRVEIMIFELLLLSTDLTCTIFSWDYDFSF